MSGHLKGSDTDMKTELTELLECDYTEEGKDLVAANDEQLSFISGVFGWN